MDIGSRGAGPKLERPRLRLRAGLAAGLGEPLQPFFATAAVPCPYIAGRAERKLIVELSGREAAVFYDDLSRAGFRRSHRFAYRPACGACEACVPVRIAVERFTHSRSTRRVRNLNRALIGALVPARSTQEQYQLFLDYQRARHADSEMADMTYGDYRAMVEDTPVRTATLEFRDEEGRLVAATLLDRLDDGLSAVYSFYAPDAERQSLGTWSILWLVEECQRRALPYVYLGYWIAQAPKMAYKGRFAALERLGPDGWVPLTPQT
ncbi:MAG TPA: arginyltransferase [Stellaceae bacterium]|jgi:arginine-tRNA-protein transferase|nr:arginyltransferase [Stellaceae bacterium]